MGLSRLLRRGALDDATLATLATLATGTPIKNGDVGVKFTDFVDFANANVANPANDGEKTPQIAGLSQKLIDASVALDRQQAALPDDLPVCDGVWPNGPAWSPTEISTYQARQGSWHVSAAWRPAARAYLNHHAHCPQCKVAGRRLGNRCDTGGKLWAAYQDAFDTCSKK